MRFSSLSRRIRYTGLCFPIIYAAGYVDAVFLSQRQGQGQNICLSSDSAMSAGFTMLLAGANTVNISGKTMRLAFSAFALVIQARILTRFWLVSWLTIKRATTVFMVFSYFRQNIWLSGSFAEVLQLSIFFFTPVLSVCVVMSCSCV